ANGDTTSDAATLSIVAPSQLGRLTNLSIRTSLDSADDNFTIGFTVGGDGVVGTKPLVIRAAGPALGAFGVPGTLADPKLEVFADATKTGENDNWGGGSALVAAMAAVGAFPYADAASRDAALTV